MSLMSKFAVSSYSYSSLVASLDREKQKEGEKVPKKAVPRIGFSQLMIANANPRSIKSE